FFQAEDGIRDGHVTGVQTCALPISLRVLHQPLNGYAQGKYAPLVATGTYLGGKNDARVGEATIEIDLKTRAARLVAAGSTRLERSEERRVGKGCRERRERSG